MSFTRTSKHKKDQHSKKVCYLLCFTFILILGSTACRWIHHISSHLFSSKGKSSVQSQQESTHISTTETKPKQTYTILLDPGHGGSDPGKIGILENVLEKDINLSIAKECKKQLEKKCTKNVAYKVILTRDSDCMLCDESFDHKKSSDMKKRRELIAQETVDLAVSIHQNSYPSQSVFGAQVFYYSQSTKGEQLAKTLQTELLACNPSNKRQAKANNDYYILKSGTCPVVICECGFLSNPQECHKLTTNAYQVSIAQAIASGIHTYFKSHDDI